jgi:hypothetical protein
MPEFCTCGAELPPDALFCHKCGKPQRTLPEPEPPSAPEPAAEAPPPVSIAAPPPPSVDFRNPIAVRIAFVMGSLATLLSWVPLLNFALWVAAGFFAVYFYRRRTGSLLNVRAGMRLGWITGVLTFLITTVLFTVRIVPMALQGGLRSIFEAQFKNLPSQDPNVEEVLRMLQSPPGIALMMLLTLFMLFGLITCLTMAGGALGAKLVGGRR